jgi:hypothetical protein
MIDRSLFEAPEQEFENSKPSPKLMQGMQSKAEEDFLMRDSLSPSQFAPPQRQHQRCGTQIQIPKIEEAAELAELGQHE